MNRFRVLLIDDCLQLLKSLRRFLALFPEFEVVGQGLDGHDGLDLAVRLRPDLVLMDLVMPGMDGLQATRRLKAGPAGSPRPARGNGRFSTIYF